MFWFQIITGCASIVSLLFSGYAVKTVCNIRAELRIGDRVSQKAKGKGNVQIGGNLNG